MRSLGVAGVTAFAFVGGALLLAPIAAASHWCGDTDIGLAPRDNLRVGEEVGFTASVKNSGHDTIALSTVSFRFSWEETFRDTAGASLQPGDLRYFTVSVAPPAAGPHSVEVRITGSSSGDPSGTLEVSCNTTFALSAYQPSPGLEAPLLALTLVAAAVWASRRRA